MKAILTVISVGVIVSSLIFYSELRASEDSVLTVEQSLYGSDICAGPWVYRQYKSCTTKVPVFAEMRTAACGIEGFEKKLVVHSCRTPENGVERVDSWTIIKNIGIKETGANCGSCQGFVSSLPNPKSANRVVYSGCKENGSGAMIRVTSVNCLYRFEKDIFFNRPNMACGSHLEDNKTKPIFKLCRHESHGIEVPATIERVSVCGEESETKLSSENLLSEKDLLAKGGIHDQSCTTCDNLKVSRLPDIPSDVERLQHQNQIKAKFDCLNTALTAWETGNGFALPMPSAIHAIKTLQTMLTAESEFLTNEQVQIIDDLLMKYTSILE